MIPVDGGGLDLTTPLGEPAAIRQAAARLASGASQSTELAGRSAQAIEHSLAHWTGQAARAFAGLAHQVSGRVREVHDAAEGIATALRRYATALEVAQEGMRVLQRRWAAAVHDAELESRRLAGGAPPGPLTPGEMLTQAQGRIERDAAELRRELAHAARAAIAEIEAWAAAGIPGGGGMSAGELAKRTWDQGWSMWSSLPAKLLQKANGLRGALNAFGRLNLYAEWAGGLAQRVGTAERGLASELEAIGDTDSVAALNAWMRFRETASAADQMLSDAQPVAAFGNAGSPALSVIGKVGLPLAMAGDVATIIKPGDEEGAHATATRVMAGANLAASGTLLAAGAGVLTLTPPGAIIVGGVLVGTAAYAVGDLVYEHRKEIGHALESAGGWVVDEVDSAADELGDVADTVADGLSDAAGAVGDAADAVGDGLSDAKDTVVHWFS